MDLSQFHHSRFQSNRQALRPGGKVVVYGFTPSLNGGRSESRSGGRHRFREGASLGLHVVRSWVLPGRKRIVPHSIRTLERLKPAWFQQDLTALLELLKEQKIKPIIAQRVPLAEARHAHELLGRGSVIGKIVLVPNSSSLASRAA